MKTSQTTYIHIGLPKTATTTLQTHLFGKHSQIYYLGKLPGYGFPPSVLELLDSSFSESWYDKIYDPADIHFQSIEQQLNYAGNHGQISLLSKEGLAGGPPEQKRLYAELLKNTFGNCRALLFIREPVSFLKSYYVQSLKGFQKRSSNGSKWMQKLPAAPHFFDVNEWMMARWETKSSPRHILQYAETANIYAEFFGKNNVKIFIFEEFVRRPNEVITDLCRYMEIDSAEALALLHGKRENNRYTTSYIENLKRLENCPEQASTFRSLNAEQRGSFLEAADGQGEKIDQQLTDTWLEKIHEVTREQNRRLVKEWDMPLADYGYLI